MSESFKYNQVSKVSPSHTSLEILVYVYRYMSSIIMFTGAIIIWVYDALARFWSIRITLQLKVEGQLERKESITISDIDNSEL